MFPLPLDLWTEVRADFEHLPNGKYILITDEYSGYMIINIINSTSARTVIPWIEKTFAEFGIPENWQFNSLPALSSNIEISHYCGPKSIPKVNASCKQQWKSIKAAHAQGLNCQQKLYKCLFGKIITSSSTTDISPTSALFGQYLKN